MAVGLPIGSLAAIWALALLAAPALVQWLVVSPNEISRERPYLAHSIRFTRQGFDLEKVENRHFPVRDELTREVVEENREVLSEVRLWDPGALEAVYEQFQEIRLYYEMTALDIDRYRFGGQYRQVMVSARELKQENLPAASQTFVNRRFKYTHGHGVVLSPVSEFTHEGLPNLLVKNIPPQSAFPGLAVSRPEIYYGELTWPHVVVNSREPEFDYPSGDENVYTRYQGTGGVPLSNLWRKFLYGWKFDGTRFLLSSYPTKESRVLFHREIHERVRLLAPFLEFDRDPYIVIDGGRLYWIMDAYTTSGYYPYSETFFSEERIEADARRGREADARRGRGEGPPRDTVPEMVRDLAGVNYVRNAVKAVVDAYHGSVTFYVFAPDDPIVRTWARIFPGLFRDQGEMPAGLRAHVRYPEGFLLAQGLVYSKYHMTDPEVLYKQEDLWVRATERYYDEIRPVDPYYVMWRPPPGEAAGAGRQEGAEFVLMMPFTPKGRHVLIGWIAGLCDGENYGRLVAYQFPKEKRVIGTLQVDTKIEQDPNLKAQLTLWDQRGARVIRGNVLVLPIGETLLYVEPIFIQADAAAYPELRVVVLMHRERMAYAPTFAQALKGLLGEAPPAAVEPERRPPEGLARQASEAFQRYLRLQGEQRFIEAARELETLGAALEQLAAGTEGAPAAPVRARRPPREGAGVR
jgi:hypothetical protein